MEVLPRKKYVTILKQLSVLPEPLEVTEIQGFLGEDDYNYALYEIRTLRIGRDTDTHLAYTFVLDLK